MTKPFTLNPLSDKEVDVVRYHGDGEPVIMIHAPAHFPTSFYQAIIGAVLGLKTVSLVDVERHFSGRGSAEERCLQFLKQSEVDVVVNAPRLNVDFYIDKLPHLSHILFRPPSEWYERLSYEVGCSLPSGFASAAPELLAEWDSHWTELGLEEYIWRKCLCVDLTLLMLGSLIPDMTIVEPHFSRAMACLDVNDLPPGLFRSSIPADERIDGDFRT